MRDALELSWQLDGVVDRAEGLRVVGETLLGLVPADVAGWNAVDVGRAEVVTVPDEPWDAAQVGEQLAEVADVHPMITSYAQGDAAPRRLSDVATPAELARNAAYVDFLRPLGAEHQLSVVTARRPPHGMHGWALNRADRDFTDGEVAVLAVLQPVLSVLDRTLGAARTAAGEAAERVRLTRRELEVLGHVSRGLTAAAIARVLRISEGTVRKHLQNAYGKLGSSDRLLAVERARALGIL